MPLTGAELDVVQKLAYPLPPASRAAFTTAVVNALEAYPVHDVGITYRIARELLPSFYRPPPPSPRPQHFNSRRFPTR
jgi:hypothetical protein